MKKAILTTIKDLFIYLILSAFTLLMLKTIISYSTLEPNVAFLKEKQAYMHITIWKLAFYVHVFTSIFTLIAGFTQFSNFVLREYKALHKIMGKLYVYAILFINFPSGFIMAIYANGFMPTKIAFIILDCLWFWFTYKAVVAIKKGDVKSHKAFMIRSYALTFSAITLRSWKIILSNSFNIDPLTVYMIDAWLGFVPNLLLAEWIIVRKDRLSAKINTIKN